MANGKHWENWIGEAIACPPEWEFGTRLVVDGREWVCLDRGSAIQFVDGIPWVDMLIEKGLYPHGSIVEAELISP